MKPFTTLAVVLLGLLASLHLVRSAVDWEVSVNGVSVPVWASALACVIAGGLALMLWKENGARTRLH